MTESPQEKVLFESDNQMICTLLQTNCIFETLKLGFHCSLENIKYLDLKLQSLLQESTCSKTNNHSR